MLVGEVPGDAEDLAGHPFVGLASACSIALLANFAVVGDCFRQLAGPRHLPGVESHP